MRGQEEATVYELEDGELTRNASPPNGYAVQLRQPAADRVAEGKDNRRQKATEPKNVKLAGVSCNGSYG